MLLPGVTGVRVCAAELCQLKGTTGEGLLEFASGVFHAKDCLSPSQSVVFPQCLLAFLYDYILLLGKKDLPDTPPTHTNYYH